ncbi:MAG: hypothetical protein OEZ54_11445 [Gemmatimonadota bacterium]|nr:hypothetical protein [Gemmatimonadota bacterium]
MKDLLKRFLFFLSPRLGITVMSARARSHSHKLIRAWGIDRLNRQLTDKLGHTVVSGPFGGMVLSRMTLNEHIGPFLLGTYESELHSWFTALEDRSFDLIVDIGAKFGYYAVGLARLNPKTPVVAFDTDPWARRALSQMITANGVTNVTVASFCTPKWLNENAGTSTFIFSDCEGCERELFLTADVSAFQNSTMIIEVHEEIVPGITDELRERFGPTHQIDSVSSHDPTPPDIDLSFLSADEKEQTVREIRGPQQWLLFSPRDE